MRISDWSSDVCSSDLDPLQQLRAAGHLPGQPGATHCHGPPGRVPGPSAGRLLPDAAAVPPDQGRRPAAQGLTPMSEPQDAPLVSVIIPTFTREAELPRAVESVLAPDYRPARKHVV